MRFSTFLVAASLLSSIHAAGTTPSEAITYHHPEQPGVVKHSSYKYARLGRSLSDVSSAASSPSHSQHVESSTGRSSEYEGSASVQRAKSPPRLSVSQMRGKQALNSGRAIVPSLADGAYRAVAGVPLAIVGAASSACGSLVSLCKGKYKEAARRINRVPDKVVKGISMTAVGSLQSTVEAGYHAGHLVSFGAAALANKAVGNDRPRKGDTFEDTFDREKARGVRYMDQKTLAKSLTKGLQHNSRKWSMDLIKP